MLIAMLEDILSEEEASKKKKKLEEKYNMVIKYNLEKGVNAMCNLSDIICTLTILEMQMREVLYEESANPSNLKTQKIIYIVYSIFLWALIISSLFVFFVEFFITGFDFLLLFLVPPAILFWFIRSKIYYCVDLIFVSGSTRVVKVVNYKKRKKVIVFDSKEVLQVGKITSGSFEKIFRTPNIKKVYASLVRKGFTFSDIKEALKTYSEELENSEDSYGV